MIPSLEVATPWTGVAYLGGCCSARVAAPDFSGTTPASGLRLPRASADHVSSEPLADAGAEKTGLAYETTVNRDDISDAPDTAQAAAAKGSQR